MNDVRSLDHLATKQNAIVLALRMAFEQNFSFKALDSRGPAVSKDAAREVRKILRNHPASAPNSTPLRTRALLEFALEQIAQVQNIHTQIALEISEGLSHAPKVQGKSPTKSSSHTPEKTKHPRV